jgi:hypothetical protein
MTDIIQTTVKELILRFKPEDLQKAMLDTAGTIYHFPVKEREEVYFAIIPDEDEMDTTVFNIVGVHNGKVVGAPLNDFDGGGTRWLDLNDEDTVIYAHSKLEDGSLQTVAYDFMYEGAELLIDLPIPLPKDAVTDVDFVQPTVTVTLERTSIGNELGHGVIPDGAYAVLQLRDTLSGHRFSYYIEINAENNLPVAYIEQAPDVLLERFPKCMELLSIGMVHKLTTYAATVIGFVDGTATEPVVTSSHSFSIADVAPQQSGVSGTVEETAQDSILHAVSENDPYVEDSDDYDEEFLEYLDSGK